MSTFDREVEKLIGIEGNYSNHISDSGGQTKYGITMAVAREHGYEGEIVNLKYSLAKIIYRNKYWDVLKLDNVQEIMPSLVAELFDTGVNQGVGRSAEYLQISLNALNRQEKDYADIKIDGQLGKRTLATLQRYVHKRKDLGEVVLLRALNCLQGSHYIGLSQRREKDEDFVFGWLLNRVNI